MNIGRWDVGIHQRVVRAGSRIDLAVRSNKDHQLTSTEALSIRDNLSKAEGVVAISSVEDPSLDGFYRLTSVDASDGIGALVDGNVPMKIRAVRVGDNMQSVLVGTVLTNDMGVTAAESTPFLAPPVAHYGFDQGATIPATVTRTGTDGSVVTFLDVDVTVNPTWNVDPSDYYKGAATISEGGFPVAHLTDPTGWQIDNSLVRVKPNGAGRLLVASYDSSWEDIEWDVQSGGSNLPSWSDVQVLYNRPERVSIRLIANITGGGRYTLDLTLRRGSRFVTGYLTRTASATLKIKRHTVEAGTTVTPTGASAPVGLRASVNDAAGNRYVIGTAKTPTFDTVNGGLSLASTTTLDFFIGSAVNGSSAQSGDQPADLCLQYLGWVSETVEAVAT